MQTFSLTQLILYFLKLGATGFGGPIALAGFMEQDLVEKKQWFSKKQYLQALALAQIVPGPLATQMAIYFGWLKAKSLGATLVGIIFVLPSFLIVWGLSYLYVKFQGLPWIHSIFYGMSAAIIGVIVQTTLKLIKISLERKKGLWLLFLLSCLWTASHGKASVLIFLSSGLLAVLIYNFPKGKLFSFPPLELFLFFAKAAVVVYGSGMAVIPFIYHDVVEGYQWLNPQQFLDAVAIGMITPGPVLITVGFIGYLVNGLQGALASAVGVFTPVYLFVLILAPFFQKIMNNIHIQIFVEGVTAAAVGAIAASAYILGLKAIVDVPTAFIALVSFLLIFRTKIPMALVILLAGLFGYALSF